jgi:hypothetical protein
MAKRSHRRFLLTGAVCSALGASAHAATIDYPVNFIGGGNNGGASVTGAAGLSNISGWNNLSGSSGSSSTITSGTGTGFSAGPNLSLTYSSNGTWNGGETADGSNGSLLNGYLDTGNTAAAGVSLTITGLPVNTGAVLTLYTDGDNGNAQSDYSVNSVDQQIYEGTGTSATLTADTATAGSPGNYLQFNLSGTSDSTIAVASNTLSEFRSPINAFELVVTTPEPASVGVLALAAGGALARRRRPT